jgi:hypothetical protein
VVFAFAVDFHNLREEELALLLYALVLEEQVSVTLRPEALSPEHHAPVTLTGPMRHKLGYGKPQGGGSVHIRVDRIDLRGNPADRYRGQSRADWVLEGELLSQEVRRRIRPVAQRTDITMQHLRAMMIYAKDDPRAGNLNYPSYGWFQEDKGTGTPLRPVL